MQEIEGNCEYCGADYKFETDLNNQIHDEKNDVYGVVCPSCKKVSQNFDTTHGSLFSPMARIEN